MPLTAGARLGHYEIQEPLGTGGMGEVYRARDTKLNRDVAIKILPDAFANDADRVARFTREAQTLATLNHPHIAHIHGLEESSGVRALVMELVEGEDLAQWIARGAIPLDEALTIAQQIAEALEAAHEQGIIHRDLKPANIKLRPDGTVKVLDFGLAKAFEATSGGAPSSVSMSPTLTAGTQLGVILGTAAYMAPEQARGKPVDKRADIWAFGCVLYEMLSGRRAFAGEEISDTLAFVLMKEIDWTALPADTPPPVRRLLRRCLEKDPKRRLRDIGEARVELEEPAIRDESAAAAPLRASQRSIGRRALPWIACAVAGSALTAIVAWTIVRPAPTALRPAQRLSITLPSTIRLAGEVGGQPAISPDGTRLVFPAIEGGKRQLYIRSLDQLEAQPIRGTDDAQNPFFSPDGEWIAFFTAAGSPAGKLKKVAVRGGPPLTIADTSSPTGAWSADGTIIFTRAEAAGTTSLYGVPSSGGTATKLTTPVPEKEYKHAFPDVLPGGRHVLFSITPTPADFERSRIAVLSLDTGQYRTVIEQGYNARYVPSGHIVYALASNLMAVPFDVRRVETTGPPVPVIEGVRGRSTFGDVVFAVTTAGLLAYAPGTASQVVQRTLVWVDRSGKEEALPVPVRHYTYPRLSPDGRHIALDIRDQDQDIWVWNVERRTLTRLTFDPSPDVTPVWTFDGKRIIFAQGLALGKIHWQAADGTGQPELLIESAIPQGRPQAVTPDGTRLLFRQSDPQTLNGIYTLSLAGDRRAAPLIQTPFNEQNAEISPDGRWVAYQSNESGQYEIHVRPFPNADTGRWQVSAGGGVQPVWSRDGRELFFLAAIESAPRVMVAAIAGGATFSAGASRQLFAGRYYAGGVGFPGRTYDVSRDGKRFLMIKDLAAESTTSTDTPLVVVLNFFDELKRLAPATP